MLARAARRKLRRDAFTTHSDQLTLPWLCPAQMRWAASLSSKSSHSHDSRKQKLQTLPPSRHDTRSLATAADAFPARYDNIPFDSLFTSWAPRLPSADLSNLPFLDPSKPLIINDAIAGAPQLKAYGGIGGDPIELHQNLHACVRVRRMERAAAIVQRLTTLYHPSSPDVVGAHNVYLRALFEIAQESSQSTTLSTITDWFNNEMVGKAVEPNAETLVILLQASMTFLHGPESESAVRDYIDMAKDFGEQTYADVLSDGHYTEEEWAILLKVQPDAFTEPPSAQELQDMRISTPAGRAIAIEHGLLSDPALKVRSVPQKGLGLATLQEALSIFEPGKGVPYPQDMEGDEKSKDRMWAYMRQIRLEENAIEAAAERWKAEDAKLKEAGIHGVLKSKPLQALMWQWYQALLPEVQKELKLVKENLSNVKSFSSRAHTDERHIYGPYLETCTPEKMCALTIQTFVSSCAQSFERNGDSGLKISHLVHLVADRVETEANSALKQRQAMALRKQRNQVRQELLGRLSKSESRAPRTSERQYNPTLDSNSRKDFPAHVKARIGSLLLEKLMRAATITVIRDDPRTGKKAASVQPAFTHTTGFLNGKKVGWVVPHYELTARLRTERVPDVLTMRLPMLVEPKPWTGFSEGGYYTRGESVIRMTTGDDLQKAYAYSAIDKGDMKKFLAGLDVLGKVPWNINDDIYRVMVHAWNNGEGIGGLVAGDDDLQQPPEPPASATYKERLFWSRQLKEYENQKSGLHSQRCFQNFQLEVARAYLNEKFYYPHSVDFRGRAYPIPPYLNHMGADLARSLLRFANGKELGTVGLQWLKIHLANLYGYDKASLKDREQFAMDHISDIYDSATNPLNGKRWWAQAEDPWQCLACCIELKNALDAPDPTRYISHLPVHQDGTCNGLQHYAALGGDRAGATQVNLEPSDRPQDIYTGVAELVKEAVAQDAERGDPVAQFLNGKITRKVVKRTVMTNVYGVTFMGAKLQCLEELKNAFPSFSPTEGMETLNKPASYIALQIFRALGKIFNGAQDIQYWLGECADRITTSITAEQIRKITSLSQGAETIYENKYKQPKKHGLTANKREKLRQSFSDFRSSVIWTTPLKLPVVQPYRNHKAESVKTSLQSINIVKPQRNNSVSKRKQLQAFPPNFIHSLDATHMILSALKCNEMGIDFAAVHDSFWTHAADIPNLNVILRDAFVRMHSEDIIGRLRAEFEARYAGSMYRAEVELSSAVGRQIREWRLAQHIANGAQLDKKAKLSKQLRAGLDEVVLEAERQRLLKSSDEAERQRGAELITPTSIYESLNDPLALKTGPKSALLGDVMNTSSSKRVQAARMEVLGAEADANAQAEDCMEENAEADIEDEEKEPKAEAEADNDIAAETVDNGAAIPRRGRRDKSVRTGSTIQVWLPVTFPPVPEKGDWDVGRLRESKYFFS